jgi:hypothetical protein
MEQLYKDYRTRGFEFFLVYTREAHPGEKVPAHSSLDEKLQNACRLRDEEKLTVPILVDSMDGAVHQSYGASDLTNSTCPRLHVIDKDGRVIFKATWTDARELRLVIEDLIEREARVAEGYRLKEGTIEKIQFPLRDLPERKRVLGRAGEGSIADWEVVHGKIKE